ncbi:helix-turn-helix domain-containing protein [Methylobacterium sp. J-026]|uniref:helix-turn-helix domain-containing protein n=1 Tax=Methylobacterium sp. J-026 TaxID=2836624 RepID=UPI001FB9C9F0|nr:helix-turn-helix domain-containing protein [Methylobacterium sp. J-026]MCJ2138415.1 helix-turn-helix domain-containing protein [Methylobacterium sp. J-026]
MFADEIRRAIEAADRITLPSITALLWRAYGEGKVTEAEAEALSGLIETRTLSKNGPRSGQSPNSGGTAKHSIGLPAQKCVGSPRRPGVGSRPRTDASMERRRRWAASGRMPLGLAAKFTHAEQGVLALVAAEVARRGDCRLAIDNVAAVVGVSRSTVKNAIREAVRLGFVTVEERQVTGWRNDTNIVRIVSREWLAWLRLARKGDPLSNRREQAAPSLSQGGGVKSATTTSTQVLDLGESRKTEPKKGCRQAAGDLDRSDRARIRAGGGGG